MNNLKLSTGSILLWSLDNTFIVIEASSFIKERVEKRAPKMGGGKKV